MANSPESGKSGDFAAPKNPPISKGGTRFRWFRALLVGVFSIYLGVAAYFGWFRTLPEGLSLEGKAIPVATNSVQFLYDITADHGGERVHQQMIFDRVIEIIRQAEDFILSDFFLFNEYKGADTEVHRKLCRQITDALLDAKRRHPSIQIVFVTDPVNEVYGGSIPPHIHELRDAGIVVIATNLKRLPDSNPVYSAFWRMFVQWFGNSPEGTWMRHPFASKDERISVRSWLELLNFKANHRKLIVADAPRGEGGREMVCMTMSANPHDASSAHSNVALLVRQGPWLDLVRSEQSILSFSGSDLDLTGKLPNYATNPPTLVTAPNPTPASVRVVTESKIRNQLLSALESTTIGDSVQIAMFYLSERSIVTGLVNAAQRGAKIRLILDPNRDAFGYEKNGVPNRPVAVELMERGGPNLNVRWYQTRGEQFHTKLTLIRHGKDSTLFVGSANLTRRNIGDYNLETDLMLTAPTDFPAVQAAQDYFERIWSNRELSCTLPYSAFADPSPVRKWLYRAQEFSGVCTF